MTNGKRILCAILAVILLVSTTAFACADETAPADSLYIQTLSCPADIMNYAVANTAKFVMSMDETSSLDYSLIHLGQPFTYGDSVPNLFTFPVFNGEKVIYTFRVAYSPDGIIQGTMSTFLVDKLNAHMGKTTEDAPLLFDVIGNALYVCVEDEAEKIYEFPEYESVSNDIETESYGLTAMEIKDISDFIDVDFFWSSARSTYQYIALDLQEIQFGNNWCSAYVTAAIIRTQTGFKQIMAKDVMEWCYGEGVSSAQALPVSDAAYYAREVARLTATTYSATALSNSRLVAEIDYGRPVYLCMTNKSDDGKTSHAIALRGYHQGNAIWSIWNPVNENLAYETFTMGGDYVSTTGNIFYYDGRTIYNFYANW